MKTIVVAKCLKCGLKKTYEMDLSEDKLKDVKHLAKLGAEGQEYQKFEMDHAKHKGYTLLFKLDKDSDLDEIMAELKEFAK